MLRAIEAEVRKLKGSFMPLWTALAVILIPLLQVGNQLRNPNDALTWEVFMRLEPPQLAGFGAMLFGLVAAYLFAHEHADGMANEMLTLPIRREYFVVAKLLVLGVWVLLLAVLAVLVEVAYATLLGLDGASWKVAWDCLSQSVQIELLVLATLPIVGLIAMVRKGYLEAMSYSGVMMLLGMGFGVAGKTRWFPWSMPSGVARGVIYMPDRQLQDLVAGSWMLMAALFLAGSLAVMVFVDRADAA